MVRADGSEYFTAAFTSIRRYVCSTYGVRCVRSFMRAAYFGDLNGAEIRIANALGPEDSLFILLHLFGHTVQWNTRGIMEFRVGAGLLGEEGLAEMIDYEREACRFSMTVLLGSGFEEFGQWLSDFSAADLRLLIHFYRTGERLGVREFWRSGEPLILPLEIPDFHPQVLRWRWEGVVI